MTTTYISTDDLLPELEPGKTPVASADEKMRTAMGRLIYVHRHLAQLGYAIGIAVTEDPSSAKNIAHHYGFALSEIATVEEMLSAAIGFLEIHRDPRREGAMTDGAP